MDKGKRKIRGETSKWIGENVQSEKERHHNGGKKDNQRRRDITMDKGKRTIREGETSQWREKVLQRIYKTLHRKLKIVQHEPNRG